MQKKICKVLLLLFILFSFFSCKTTDDSKLSVESNEMTTGKKPGTITDKQTALLKMTNTLVGKKTYSKTTVKGKVFMLDCIGTVSAIYYGIGIDIQKEFMKFEGNGVSRFYQYLNKKDNIFKKEKPKIGDVVFFDNTWDKNEDGKMGNDPLTHAGIVVEVINNKTIKFVHANYVKGIVIESMNLANPDVYKNDEGKVINDILALGATLKKHPAKWITGNLWNSYGIVF